MYILVQIRDYPQTYAEFTRFLGTTDINNVSNFLKLKDELAYGYIMMFVHHKHMNFQLGDSTISILINSEACNSIGVRFIHMGLSYAYIEKIGKLSFQEKMNRLIIKLFYLLDKNAIY